MNTMLDWFNAREATEIGTALADEFAPRAVAIAQGSGAGGLEQLFRRADSKVSSLRLTFFKKAKFANSFKWRLIEHGIAREVADELTQSLVLHLSNVDAVPTTQRPVSAANSKQPSSADRKRLFALGNQAFARGAYTESVDLYQELLELEPRNTDAVCNMGAAFTRLSLLNQAAQCFCKAIEINPDCAEAHRNLGVVLRLKGETAAAESWLRQAVVLNPKDVDARVQHGASLLGLGRLREAKSRFEKVLKTAPRHAEATFLMGQVARFHGRFQEAETRFKRALQIQPKMPSAWAALAGTRKMSESDSDWLQVALEIAASGIPPVEEADVRFAIGKYFDDIQDFDLAFQHYQRANLLLKSMADPYDPDARACFVDDLIRIYTADAISAVNTGAWDSTKPIFVVGMPRSGTSMVEQIIASHPGAKGAGELGFVDDAMRAHDSEMRQGLLSERTRAGLADVYLRALEMRAGGAAARIVDKAPVNADYLGVIYSVFPNARIIHIRRDPIDSCLSCFFQHFSAAMNFTTDLSDLAHYFRHHRRLMAHWRAVLPTQSMLEVPYAGLVDDQEGWTRKILSFLGLDWDPSCIDFHLTESQVLTTSSWQVRQKLYKSSIGRWRHYKKFIGPLLDLKD